MVRAHPGAFLFVLIILPKNLVHQFINLSWFWKIFVKLYYRKYSTKKLILFYFSYVVVVTTEAKFFKRFEPHLKIVFKSIKSFVLKNILLAQQLFGAKTLTDKNNEKQKSKRLLRLKSKKTIIRKEALCVFWPRDQWSMGSLCRNAFP